MPHCASPQLFEASACTMLPWQSRLSGSLSNPSLHREPAFSLEGQEINTTRRSARANSFAHSWIRRCLSLHLLYVMAMSLYTFGLCCLFQRQMAFPYQSFSRRMRAMDLYDRNLDVDAGGFISGHHQWNRHLAQMEKVWVITRKGCILLLPLSLAFLQVNGVSDNVYTRTAALSAFICSITGLVASNWYLVLDSRFRTRRIRKRWIEASSFETGDSVDFWVFISLPLSALVWSIFFCTSTIFFVIWTRGVDTPRTSGRMSLSFTTSAVFMTVLTASHIVQVYRGIKLLRSK